MASTLTSRDFMQVLQHVRSQWAEVTAFYAVWMHVSSVLSSRPEVRSSRVSRGLRRDRLLRYRTGATHCRSTPAHRSMPARRRRHCQWRSARVMRRIRPILTGIWSRQNEGRNAGAAMPCAEKRGRVPPGCVDRPAQYLRSPETLSVRATAVQPRRSRFSTGVWRSRRRDRKVLIIRANRVYNVCERLSLSCRTRSADIERRECTRRERVEVSAIQGRERARWWGGKQKNGAPPCTLR